MITGLFVLLSSYRHLSKSLRLVTLLPSSVSAFLHSGITFPSVSFQRHCPWLSLTPSSQLKES